MYNIGLIEDNQEQRIQLQQNIKLTIEDDFGIDDVDVVGIPPYSDNANYVSWIQANDIAVILTDERLYEIGAEYGDGHSLVEFLKPFFPGLKFFILTSYPEDEDLKGNQASNFFVIDKNKFNTPDEDSYKKNHLHLILNSAKDFRENFLDELKSLKILSDSCYALFWKAN